MKYLEKGNYVTHRLINGNEMEVRIIGKENVMYVNLNFEQMMALRDMLTKAIDNVQK